MTAPLPFVQVHHDFYTSPRVTSAARVVLRKTPQGMTLRMATDMVVGICVRLWGWAQSGAPAGELTIDNPETALADILLWDGMPEDLALILTTAGVVRLDGTTIHLCGWTEAYSKILQKRGRGKMLKEAQDYLRNRGYTYAKDGKQSMLAPDGTAVITKDRIVAEMEKLKKAGVPAAKKATGSKKKVAESKPAEKEPETAAPTPDLVKCASLEEGIHQAMMVMREERAEELGVSLDDSAEVALPVVKKVLKPYANPDMDSEERTTLRLAWANFLQDERMASKGFPMRLFFSKGFIAEAAERQRDAEQKSVDGGSVKV